MVAVAPLETKHERPVLALTAKQMELVSEAEDLLSSTSLRFWYYQSGGPTLGPGERIQDVHFDLMSRVVARLTELAEERLSQVPQEVTVASLERTAIRLLQGEVSNSSFLLEGERPLWEAGEISLINSIVARFGPSALPQHGQEIEAAAEQCFLRNLAERHLHDAERLAPLLKPAFLKGARVLEALRNYILTGAGSKNSPTPTELLTRFPFNLHPGEFANSQRQQNRQE